MILGTAGHIDHGKTALVRALTGVDTDRLPEEKRRGITIDLGFAPLHLEGPGTIGIVDVPGHEAFIRTMLAGASGIDIALVVIAADEGVMPQTVEHLEILSLLGVGRGVVALTKSDLVDVDWLGLQMDEVKALIATTPLASAAIVPVSAKTGSGISELKTALADLAASIPARNADDDLFRLPVDRAFTIKGTGTVVTGTVWSGSVQRDATLIVHPSGKTARVRGIELHGKAATHASAGHRTAIALAGVDLAEVGRGTALVADPAWTPTSDLEALIELNGHDARLTPRTRVLFHLGTAETEAKVVSIDADLRNENKRHVRIRLANPIIARAGDRFVLRLPSPARTIGGGTVIDPYAFAHKRTRSKTRPNKVALDQDASATVEGLLEKAGSQGVESATLPIRTGLSPREVKTRLDNVSAVPIGTRRYGQRYVDQLMTQLEALVRESVANHPLEPGVSLQAIRLAAGKNSEIVGFALNRLVESGKIELAGSLVCPAGWKSKLGDVEQGLSVAIMIEICERPSEPPTVAELEVKFGSKTVALLRKMERDRQLERVSDDRYYSTEEVARIVSGMRSKLEVGRVYTPAELREVLGVSRKYLIPFLEFCDRKGVTERRQDGRAVRPMAVPGRV
ncbi:MAG: selenocysteine-specific translation elongation factor [Gemmatimonadaceae bacterium]